METGIICLEDGELLHTLAIQKDRMPDGSTHKIVTKTRLDGKIEGASIFDFPDGQKQVAKFTSTPEEAGALISGIIEAASQAVIDVTGERILYSTYDFSIFKTWDEQLKVIQQHPEMFSQRDYTVESKRVLRIDNPFLLDN